MSIFRFQAMLAMVVGLVFLSADSYADQQAKVRFIDTPDSCYTVSLVEGNKVYLDQVSACNGKSGRAYLQTALQEVDVYVSGSFWQRRKVQELTINDVATVLEKSDGLAKDMVIPVNPANDAMLAKAEQVNKIYQSAEFQKKIAEEVKRIQSGMFAQDEAAQVQYPDAALGSVAGFLQSDERVYLFISASMPPEVLRAYVASVERFGDPRISVVLRGFIGGMQKVQPTVQFIGDMLKRSASCSAEDCEFRPVGVIIDPLLYRRYKIDRVPAVVYVRGLSLGDPKQSEGKDDNIKAADSKVVYGDASLEYILSLIQKEVQSDSLKAMVERVAARR